MRIKSVAESTLKTETVNRCAELHDVYVQGTVQDVLVIFASMTKRYTTVDPPISIQERNSRLKPSI